MTQEEKAKAYDEAIERSKNYYSTTDSASDIKLIGLIFPELKGSEDERIRKELLNAFQESEDSLYMVLTPQRRKSFIAWLEKQGKNNMGISEATKHELEDNLNKALEKETPESWNKFLDEQKSEDKIESRQEELTEFEKAVKQVMEEAIECGDTHNLKADADMLLRLVRKPAAWSEEDMEMSRFIGNAITVNDASIYLESKGIQVIDAHVWLEELKERVQPQSTWKPSDEQMGALDRAQAELCSTEYNKPICDLIDSLKKLREE